MICTAASSDTYCVLGAGSSGLAVAKNFLAFGIKFECLEREDDVGGNWYFGKPCSRVFDSTRLISSKRQTEYTDFPMPREWPEHPAHQLVCQYLRDYARHFGLYPYIRFNSAVLCIEPAAGNRWLVTLADGSQRTYCGIVIANGHNWDPRWPSYEGEFTGEAIHSSQYKTPDVGRGRRVLVVGGGNSGFDIAVDVSPTATATYHSLRRRYHVLPRYLGGVPIDQCGGWARRWHVPLWMRRISAYRALRAAWSEEVVQCLDKPDHALFETHPVINSRWPYAVASGAVQTKPDVKRLIGNEVQFVDGSRETLDMIIYATGYKISFPFIDRQLLNWRGDRPALYLNVFHPERDDLFVAGLIQPDSGQFGLVDLQSQLIAAFIRASSNDEHTAENFRAAKRRHAGEAVTGGIRYVRSPRHLIEVEHDSYRRRLQRWISRFPSAPAGVASELDRHPVDA